MYERTLRELIDELNRLTALYDVGTPEVSDKEWDELYFELVKREELDGVIYPDSPTQKISYQLVSELNKVEHNHPMLSLAKTKDRKELESFLSDHSWLAMFKMDGLTCSLRYVNGELVGAETRGNGIFGEDILHNIKVVKNVPSHIPTKEEVVIDGEIICTYDDFEAFRGEYKNPRNFAAGSIRLLDSKECASRKLRFVAWDLIKGCEDIDFFIWRLAKLDEWGFEVVPAIGDAETVDDAIEWFDEERKTRENFKNYPIDGYVFKFESRKYGEQLGRTDHHFKNAIAFKFYDDEIDTKLTGIEWSLGRTGVLTPVALYEDIDIEGTVCNRASLHNVSVLRETLHTPYIGQPIRVAKMNQIIPQVVWAADDWTIDIPVLLETMSCPVCGKQVKTVESDSGVLNLICNNPQCEGQLSTKIDHFVGKKGLNIKGLSEKTISKLIDWGWVDNLIDIFYLNDRRPEWVAKPGFGAASVDKVLNGITKAKEDVDVAAFISGLGIPLIGSRIAKEIVKVYPTWKDFREAVGGKWSDLDGFGAEMEHAINSFDYAEADKIAEMLTFKQQEAQDNVSSSAEVNGKTFVITGCLLLIQNRQKLSNIVEEKGGKVTNSVSSKTNYLVCNDKNSTSTKMKKAKELNIPIINEQELLELCDYQV